MYFQSLILAAFVTLTLAFDPTDRDCDNRLCLTSFIWCEQNDCYYPDNVYQYTIEQYQGPPAILTWYPSKPYNITWKNHDRQSAREVPQSQLWFCSHALDILSVSSGTFRIPQVMTPASQSSGKSVSLPYVPAAVRSYNRATADGPNTDATAGASFYEWTPNASDFPNVTDLNAAEAQGLTSNALNIISITQPEAALASSQYDDSQSIFSNLADLGLWDQSQQFALVSD